MKTIWTILAGTLLGISALTTTAHASVDDYVRASYSARATEAMTNAQACVVEIESAFVGNDYVSLTCDGTLVFNKLVATRILTSAERVTAILTAGLKSGLNVSFRSETQIYLLRRI